MTPEELEAQIKRGSVDGVVRWITCSTEKERRAAAPVALARLRKLFKDVGIVESDAPELLRFLADAASLGTRRTSMWDFWRRRADAAEAAVLGTATLSELKRVRDGAGLALAHAYDILTVRKPDWLAEWSEWTLEQGILPQWGQSESNWQVVRRLVGDGVCPRPESDGFITCMVAVAVRSCETRLGHPNTTIRDWLLKNPDLLDNEVWRIFEVEGARQLSLAGADKYISKGFGWSDSLLALMKERRLDRQRLLSASLGALERGFQAFHAGWFSRFHEALEPTLEERLERLESYLALVSSTTPPTVSFALKALAEIDKAGKLPPERLIDSLVPALSAREKGTVISALRLLERAAKREPSIASQAAIAAVDALIHPAAEAQSKALDAIEKADVRGNLDLQNVLVSRLEDVAPSLRGRLAALLPDETSTSSFLPVRADSGSDEALETRAAALDACWATLAGIPEAIADLKASTLTASALNISPLRVPRLDPAKKVEPITDVDALIDLFSSVIEHGGPPDDIERVMDGVSRLCGNRPANLERRASALRKRAREKLGLDRGGQQVGGAANIVCRLAIAWIDHTVVRSPPTETTLFSFFEHRAKEIAGRVAIGESAQLFAAPTHSGGWIDPHIAMERFLARAGRPVQRSAPGGGILGLIRSVASDMLRGDGADRYDLIQALLRLAPDHRAEALEKARAVPGETGAALCYALGGQGIAIGRDAALWIAAARARDPQADHPEIERRFPGLGPAAGMAARVNVHWCTDAGGKHSTAELKCEPAQPGRIAADMPTVLHYAWRRSKYGWQAWLVFTEVGLLSTIWPLDRSAWLAMGTYTIGSNVNWWEARWDDREYIELLVDPDTSLAGHGLPLLVLGLAAKEAGQAGAAADVLIQSIADGRVVPDGLGEALARAVRLAELVPSRWARTLTDASRISPLHAVVILRSIERLFASRPPRKLAEMVGLLDLMHELCAQTGNSVNDEQARSWLAEFATGSGKTAKLAKSLLALEAISDSAIREAAVEQLRNRIERAERWQRIATAT